MIKYLCRRSAGLSAAAFAFGLVGLACSAFAHGDHGGGADGSVLPPGVTVVTLQYDVVDYRQISDARLSALAVAGFSEVHSLRSIAVPSVGVAYGLTKDFTIAARLPYLANQEIRETDIALPGVNPRGGVYGIGDASFTGTYRFLDDHHAGIEAAIIFGFKAPTGRTNAVDANGELFETEHQPGSGSWDALLGASVTKQIGLWSLGANALYARSGAGSQDTRLGDRLSTGVSASYRIWSDGGGHGDAMHLGGAFDGMMHHGGVDHNAAEPSLAKALDVSLGLNGQWSGKQTIAGEQDGNTGGTVVFLTPGLRLSVDKWSGFVNVGIPVARQLNGIQSEPRLQVSTGVAVRF